MAERSLSVCDLDNEPTISVAQVVVTVDGQERTFDLCDKHLDAFRAAVAPFAPGGAGRRRGRPAKSAGRAAKKTTAKTTAAKSTGRAAKKSTAKRTTAKATTAKTTAAKARPGRPAKAARRASASGASNTAAVRAWAREQGIAVPERGRLGRDLLERYQAATAGSAGA